MHNKKIIVIHRNLPFFFLRIWKFFKKTIYRFSDFYLYKTFKFRITFRACHLYKCNFSLNFIDIDRIVVRHDFCQLFAS